MEGPFYGVSLYPGGKKKLIITRRLFRGLLTPWWLRPERALWDAHAFAAIVRLTGKKIQRPCLEYGCTDGTYSFLLHGGELKFSHDDYCELNLHSIPFRCSRKDLFRQQKISPRQVIRKKAKFAIDLGVSWEPYHLKKAARLGLYKKLALCRLGQGVPGPKQHFATIWGPNLFWNRPERFAEVMKSLRESVTANGRLILIVPDVAQRRYEFWSRHPGISLSYQKELDRGIRQNLLQNAKSDKAWRAFFQKAGWRVCKHEKFLPPLVGWVYQIGLRPLFPNLLQFFMELQKRNRRAFLKMKKNWIQSILQNLEPLCDLPKKPGSPVLLWHAYEVRRDRS